MSAPTSPSSAEPPPRRQHERAPGHDAGARESPGRRWAGSRWPAGLSRSAAHPSRTPVRVSRFWRCTRSPSPARRPPSNAQDVQARRAPRWPHVRHLVSGPGPVKVVSGRSNAVERAPPPPRRRHGAHGRDGRRVGAPLRCANTAAHSVPCVVSDKIRPAARTRSSLSRPRYAAAFSALHSSCTANAIAAWWWGLPLPLACTRVPGGWAPPADVSHVLLLCRAVYLGGLASLQQQCVDDGTTNLAVAGIDANLPCHKGECHSPSLKP